MASLKNASSSLLQWYGFIEKYIKLLTSRQRKHTIPHMARTEMEAENPPMWDNILMLYDLWYHFQVCHSCKEGQLIWLKALGLL